MSNFVIVGGGGFGRETAWMIQELGGRVAGFFDDYLPEGVQVDQVPVMGSVAQLNEQTERLNVVVAIADPQARQKVVSRLHNPLLRFPNVVHPTARLGFNNKMGKGCIVTAGVICTTHVSLGDFVIVNLGTTIGHDTTIGSYSSLMPQAAIAGNVRVEMGVFVGSHACVLQQRRLGARCTVGAGAVVTRDVAEGTIVKGVPAKAI